MKQLIFFTAEFPYGSGETFIENELPFLAKNFEKIFIISGGRPGSSSRSIPANAVVINLPDQIPVLYKAKAVFKFFSSDIGYERNFVRRKLKLSINKAILSALLGGYGRAKYVADFTGEIIKTHRLLPENVVLYSYWMNNTAAGIALYKRRNPGVRAVCRAHGWDVYFERHQPPYLPLRHFIITNLDGCYCISQNGQDYLQDLLEHHNDDKIHISKLGTFNEGGALSAPDTGKLVLVSCSSIISLKRIHLVIEALALIKNIQVEWTHFGTGKLEAEIRSKASNMLGSLSNIKYCFAGQISNKELLKFYENNPVDLFINLSETEGLPVSIMEAGSFGIPVIATDVGGVAEIIKDGVNGFLLPASVLPGQVAGAIRNFYILPKKKKEEMRSHAFMEWRKNYNANANYSGFILELLCN